jgi:dTDP-4-amino-4,6-dideoxygalactose transaminase
MINASLGAHYSNKFVLQSIKEFWLTLFGLSCKKNSNQLKNELNKFFKGEIDLVYKGRDAIELSLRKYGIINKKDKVITQGFTCYAIEEAISRAGATTVYADIKKDTLNLSVETIKKVVDKNTKAVIVQHSLGHPAEIEKISKWCKENKILLIEDLAQSFGAKNKNEELLGTNADVIILSFGRDKVIDAITGGAVIYKKQPTEQTEKIGLPKKKIILKDLSYPFITWLIRNTYKIGIGKIIHLICRKIGLLTSPVNTPTKKIRLMPSSLAKLAILQIKIHKKTLNHRKKISQIYSTSFKSLKVKTITNKNDLNNGSLLRFALPIPNYKKLLKIWKKQNIHLSDRWYRQVVDCGKINCSKFYKKGTCPNAEKASQQIINLPTHSKISISDAKKIIAGIEQLYKL